MNRRQFINSGISAGLAFVMQPAKAGTCQSSVPAKVDNLASGSAFGTRWNLSLSAGADPEPAIKIIRAVVRLVDRSLSPYRTDSELCGFNRISADQSLNVSDTFQSVVGASLLLARRSNGAFDPTIGPVVNRYGFGPIVDPAGSTDEPPAHYTDITLQGNTLRKSVSHATVDPCGIAKGYTLDVIARRLIESGYDDFLLELGGEVVARGSRAHYQGVQAAGRSCRRPWIIGIELPPKAGQPWLRCPLINTSVATSGIAHNSYRLLENQYNHLINPSTGTVTDNTLFSVTVIHENAMLADGWSTALFVAGEQNGLELAREHNLTALFIRTGSDRLPYETTGGFALATG